jgi:membrane-bound lytic murein transglycosylase B
MRRIFSALIFAFLWLMPVIPLQAASSSGIPEIFATLHVWLISQEINEQQVRQWLASASFEGKILSSMFAHKEVTRNYTGFFSADHIKRARNFKLRYEPALQQIATQTDVPAGIIVAILLIESDLGAYSGKTIVFNSLASQAVLDTKPGLLLLSNNWPRNQADYLKTTAALDRFNKRAAWARDELLALIRLSSLWGVSPFTIKGSVAGALGWCQFMPTSIERWGRDGSGDNRIDMNNPLDAIASIANYLQEHGWRPGLNYQEQLNVILTYNKSTPYAEAILSLAEKI